MKQGGSGVDRFREDRRAAAGCGLKLAALLAALAGAAAGMAPVRRDLAAGQVLRVDP